MDLASVVRLAVACAVVALVLAAFRFAMRASLRGRVRPHARGRLVDVLESTPLPNGASLHVVRVAARYLVVARGASTISALGEVDSAAVAAWAGGRGSP